MRVHLVLFGFLFSLAGLLSSAPSFAEIGERRTITTADLVALRDIAAMAVSPDGSHVAYQLIQADPASNSHRVSWQVISTQPGSEPVTVANNFEGELATFSTGAAVGEIRSGEVVWSRDGEWIVYTAAKDGEVQIWRSRFDRYGQTQLTSNAANVEGPKFSDDGSILFFATGRDRDAVRALNAARARHGYLVQDPPTYIVGVGPLLPPCSDNRERGFTVANETLTCQLTIWALDWETGAERRATPEEVEAYYSEPDTSFAASTRRGWLRDQSRQLETLSSDERRSAWFENEDSEVFRGPRPPLRVAIYDGDEIIRCHLDECRSNIPLGMWWSDSGGEVVFLVRNGHNNSLNSLFSWTPGANEVRTILTTDDVFSDCTMANARLICSHESWTTPRRIVSVELVDGTIATIADPNPEFQNFNFTRIEKILGHDAYGNEAHAHLVYPRGYREGQRYPLVIVQYRSRGFLRGGVGDEQPIHVFAQNGFAVLSFDTPTIDAMELEGDHLALQAAYFRHTIVDRGPATAIEQMVDELGERGIVDPLRVGISGLSHGTTTLESAILARDYAAASSSYSVSPSPAFEAPATSFWGQAMNQIFGGTPYSSEGSEARRTFSINWNAGQINTPYLLQVADREYRLTAQNYHALLDAGKPVEMHIFPDEYHVKYQPAHRLTVYNRNLDWFNFWLRGVEDSDPAKVDQYERWRALRELQPTRSLGTDSDS